MALNGLSPLRDLMTLRDSMDRLFDDRWISPGSWLTWTGVGTQQMPLDVYETPDDIIVRALLPGVHPDAIDVQFQNGTLTIRTEVDALELPENGNWLVREISGGQSIRQITLPPKIDVEHVQTAFENGLLTLTLPKMPDAKPKQIKVASARQLGSGTAAN